MFPVYGNLFIWCSNKKNVQHLKIYTTGEPLGVRFFGDFWTKCPQTLDNKGGCIV